VVGCLGARRRGEHGGRRGAAAQHEQRSTRSQCLGPTQLFGLSLQSSSPPCNPQHARKTHTCSVGKAKADERKRKEADGKPKAGANNSAKGGKGAAAANGNSVFADFDRAFAAQAARERDAKAAAAAAQAAPAARFGGNFAHLAAAEDRQQQRRGGDSSDDEGSSSAKPAAPAPAKKPKAPKAPKKPRVGVAQAASSVDVGVVQEVIAALQQRYAGNEASQVEVMADSVAKLFKEAQVWGRWLIFFTLQRWWMVQLTCFGTLQPLYVHLNLMLPHPPCKSTRSTSPRPWPPSPPPRARPSRMATCRRPSPTPLPASAPRWVLVSALSWGCCSAPCRQRSTKVVKYSCRRPGRTPAA
jgi:hypothetical protein